MSAHLAHFEILEQIGKGGMATVYRALDPSLNRQVAIKVMSDELAREDPQFVADFIREAQNVAALNHPNIVQIYFVGEEAGQHFIVMELLEGQTLDDVLEQVGPLEEGYVLQLAIRVTEALKAAYASKLVHGDIKPQNIYITTKGEVKLLDFGLAKVANLDTMDFWRVLEGGVAKTNQVGGMIWGSAYYMSPERVGQRAEDFRSDIYSLGAVMFHALTGRPPFDAETQKELAVKRLKEPPAHLRTLNPDISRQTGDIVAKMLEKTPFMRQVSYDVLLEELETAETRRQERKRSDVEVLVEDLDPEIVARVSQIISTMKAQGKSTGSIHAAIRDICPGNADSIIRLMKSLTSRVEVPPPKSRAPLIIILAAALALVAAGALLFLLLHKKTPSTAPVKPPRMVSTPAPTPAMNQ
jgi:serine/threonine-protein kinase